MNKYSEATARLSLKAILLASVTVVTGLGAAVSAHAQTQPANNNFWTRPLMTGDWNGGRTKLKNDGLDFHGFYVGEFADVLSGGKRQGNGYAQQLGVSVDVDLGKIADLTGAVLHFGFNQRQGRSVSSDFIGNKLAAQEVYGAGETLRVTEMSYEQTLAHGLINTKIGFYPFGNDFALTVLGCDFQNVGFCAHPQNLPGSSGYSDYPTGKWGGRVKVNITPALYAEAGVFDSNPTYYAHNNGLKVGMSGSTGAIIPFEVGYTTALGDAKLPGHYKVGGYYDTSTAADAAVPHQVGDGRYGGYILVDQMLFSFNGTPSRGLIAMAQVSYSDPKTAVFESTIDAGLIAQGLFDARPHDFIAVGYVRAGLNSRTATAKQTLKYPNATTGEGVIEVGYGLQVTPWLLIHPNVQYIMDPGTFAYKHIPNAWVFGAQTKIVF
ncbi:MAG TPA: carbohydrate porin [Acidocella sp.]|nr:carbohydrate porin [Acidocella sp.]